AYRRGEIEDAGARLADPMAKLVAQEAGPRGRERLDQRLGVVDRELHRGEDHRAIDALPRPERDAAERARDGVAGQIAEIPEAREGARAALGAKARQDAGRADRAYQGAAAGDGRGEDRLLAARGRERRDELVDRARAREREG